MGHPAGVALNRTSSRVESAGRSSGDELSDFIAFAWYHELQAQPRPKLRLRVVRVDEIERCARTRPRAGWL